MILSEKKASAALKPWWDIIYGHGLLALLGLGIYKYLHKYKGTYYLKNTIYEM